MKPIDIFYQGENIADVDHLQLPNDTTLVEIKRQMIAKHNAPRDSFLSCEDSDEIPEDETTLVSVSGSTGARLHLHRCKHVVVTVNFAGNTVHRKFGPGTTLARVARWATRREFGMTKDEAGEHLLQLAGTHKQPAASTHLGQLSNCPDCAINFDLVVDERVNG